MAFEKLSEEVLRKILLDTCKHRLLWIACARVNKKWYSVTHDEKLWENACKNEYPITIEIQKYIDTTWLHLYQQMCLTETSEVLFRPIWNLSEFLLWVDVIGFTDGIDKKVILSSQILCSGRFAVEAEKNWPKICFSFTDIFVQVNAVCKKGNIYRVGNFRPSTLIGSRFHIWYIYHISEILDISVNFKRDYDDYDRVCVSKVNLHYVGFGC